MDNRTCRINPSVLPALFSLFCFLPSAAQCSMTDVFLVLTKPPMEFCVKLLTTNISESEPRTSQQIFHGVYFQTYYQKVVCSSLSWLVAHFQIFRRLMKGTLDAYVLWHLAKKFQHWIVDRSTASDFMVAVKFFLLVTLKILMLQNILRPLPLLNLWKPLRYFQ